MVDGSSDTATCDEQNTAAFSRNPLESQDMHIKKVKSNKKARKNQRWKVTIIPTLTTKELQEDKYIPKPILPHRQHNL